MDGEGARHYKSDVSHTYCIYICPRTGGRKRGAEGSGSVGREGEWRGKLEDGGGRCRWKADASGMTLLMIRYNRVCSVASMMC